MKKPLATYHHGDLRAAILAAARRALEAESPGGLSLRGVAGAVGVSPNAPYRHFPTKESLLAALAAEGFAELTASFSPHDHVAGAGRMEGCLEAYLLFARTNPGLYRLMFGRNLDALSCDPALGANAQACFAALMAAVGWILDLDTADSRVAGKAAMVWSLSHGAALLDIDGATAFLAKDERPGASDLARMVMSGLGA